MIEAYPESRPGTAGIEGQICGLLKALGHSELQHDTLALFREIWSAAALQPPIKLPRWSGITDDSTPIEFSIQFGRSARFRMLIEPQADPASPESYWRAGTRFTRWLAHRWNAHIDVAREIEPLFRPLKAAQVLASIGHGVEVQPNGPMFKVYYNARARGAAHSHATMARALGGLGFGKGWSCIERALQPTDRVELLALDLTDVVRVKVYVRPLQANMQRLVRLYGIAEDADPNDVPRTWATIHRDAVPERMRPVFLTYQMTDAASRRPSRVALSIPLFPGVRDDGEARRRISRLMSGFGISPDAYRRCVPAMASEPLDREEGIHSYVAFQRTSSQPVVITYLNPRLYWRRHGWIAREPVRTWPSAIVNPR